MTTKQPCTNTNCGSYNPSLKNNCRHWFKDFTTFDCLGYVAEKDKKTAPCVKIKCDSCLNQVGPTSFCYDTHCKKMHWIGIGEEHPEEIVKDPWADCEDYVPAESVQSYDKILDRMEGEVPKNGK